MPDDMHWVGTWTTTPAPAEGVAFSNQTLRMNARVSIGGHTLRVRLSNAYGSRQAADRRGACGAARERRRHRAGHRPGADLRRRRRPPPSRRARWW